MAPAQGVGPRSLVPKSFVPHGKFQRGGQRRSPQSSGYFLITGNWVDFGVVKLVGSYHHDSFLFISCRGSGLMDFYVDLTIWHIQNRIVTNGCYFNKFWGFFYFNLTHPMDFKRSPTFTNHKGPIQVTWNQSDSRSSFHSGSRFSGNALVCHLVLGFPGKSTKALPPKEHVCLIMLQICNVHIIYIVDVCVYYMVYRCSGFMQMYIIPLCYIAYQCYEFM